MMEHKSRGLFGAARIEFESLPSTNRWCLDNLPLPHGTVVTADHQTAGHGRFERPWLAMPGKSLALSIVLHTAHLPVPAPNIGQCAALAVRAMLETNGIAAKVKWPNDVIADDHKIAGILAEQGKDGNALVLGVGINLNIAREEFAGNGLASIATSMALATGKPHPPAEVCAGFLDAFAAIWGACAAGGLAHLCQTWRRHDWLADREIAVRLSGGELRGRYEGIDDTGALVLADAAGERHTVLTGDVRKIVAGDGLTK